MLKKAASVTAKPFFIINLSHGSGTVPAEWKETKVLSLFNSGSSAETDNYRTILLLHILSKIFYGVRDNDLKWFTDYLFLRKQTVNYNCVSFRTQPGFYWGFTGGIFGPLLFITSVLMMFTPLQSSRIITYADDTVIFTSSSNFGAIERNLNDDINNLATRFRKNELIINLKKGKAETMIFGTAKRLSYLKVNS